MADPLRLFGLNALVLSAASGIGEAVARTLVKHGATVLAVDTANSGVQQRFAAVKGITAMPANLIDANLMPVLIEDAVGELGGIDILVNEFPLLIDKPIAGPCWLTNSAHATFNWVASTAGSEVFPVSRLLSSNMAVGIPRADSSK